MFKKSLAAVLFVATLSACGSSATTSGTQSSAATPVTFPVTITNASGTATINAKPAAIISLSPTATEMLFAIGAGKQVIAVDDQSTYPADAPKSELSGITPNLEAIVAKKPDLVVISMDVDGLAKSLTDAGVPTLIEPAAVTLDDTYAQIKELGQATDHLGEATTLADSLKKDIDAAFTSAPKPTTPLSIYHELDNTYYSVTSSTFIGSIYKSFGLTNIADTATGAETGYPQLSAEYIVKSNPSLIFLADTKCCSVDAAAVAARPGFADLSAVKNNQIISIDDDIASRWGPRTLDFVKAVATALANAK